MATDRHPFPATGRDVWLGWGGSVAISLVLHGLVVAALLFEFGSPPPPAAAPPPAAPMVVELAAEPAASTSPASDMPDGPEEQIRDQPPTPTVDRTPPAFDPPPETRAVVPDAVPVKQDVTKPAPQMTQAALRMTAPASATAERPSETARAPVAGASDEAIRVTNQSWENQLLAHLQKYKRYPAMARALRQEDVVYLQFKVDRTGRVLSSRLVRSHGFESLDAEVAALIRRASPLPSPPATMGGSTIEMVVPIEFYLRRSPTR